MALASNNSPMARGLVVVLLALTCVMHEVQHGEAQLPGQCLIDCAQKTIACNRDCRASPQLPGQCLIDCAQKTISCARDCRTNTQLPGQCLIDCAQKTISCSTNCRRSGGTPSEVMACFGRCGSGNTACVTSCTSPAA